MKRLFVAVLPALLVITATAPTFAFGKEEGSNTGGCQSIPPARPTGVASLARLQAMQRCDLSIRSRELQTPSTSPEDKSNQPDEVPSLSPQYLAPNPPAKVPSPSLDNLAPSSSMQPPRDRGR